MNAAFRCPACVGILTWSPETVACMACGATYPIEDGIADFFVSSGDPDEIDAPNRTWLDPEIVQARDTAYSLSTHELQGMQFCMAEMASRSFSGCRVLEVCMGTGHFTRWLADVCAPGTKIYAFDFSWPIIGCAKVRTKGQPNVSLFRANARGPLPFASESFDLLLVRLSPFGGQGIAKVQAAYGWLKPGGWYFKAGWKRTVEETPPTEWAIEHGFASAQLHEWQYGRRQSAEEARATFTERRRLAEQGGRTTGGADSVGNSDGITAVTTYEHLLMARKPK